MRASANLPDAAVRCYSQRLLNPFRGVVNIIRYKSAEAVTSDGIHWDIYVSNDALLDGLDRKGTVQISDIRYGRWSSRSGLTRGPVYPSDEFFKMEEMGAVVYRHLLTVHQQLPFPFNDAIELWLLDKKHEPLALLNAVSDENEIDNYQLLDWRAGRLCRETFVFADKLNEDAGNAADYLVDYINGRAGTPASAQWFRRQPDGSASGLHGHNINEAFVGRTLTVGDFPEFFIAGSDEQAYHGRLLQSFLQWQSPWLLLLDTLDPEQRRFFEQCARKQALVVEQQYLLYPEVIDESFIRAARVEAKLRKSQMQQADQEEVMSTFYIELHPSPTE